LLGDAHGDLGEIRPGFLFPLAIHADRLVVVNGENTGVLFLERGVATLALDGTDQFFFPRFIHGKALS
jgi:hypothetical protein